MTIKNGHSSLCKFTKQVQTIKQASPSLLQQKENNWLSVFNGARQTTAKTRGLITSGLSVSTLCL